MNTADSRLQALANVRLAAALVVALVVVFGVYILAEKRVDAANENRFLTHELAHELRQSSDELTRMSRAYVATGDARYRDHFQEILDIRNGRSPRPHHYDFDYWDSALLDAQANGTGVRSGHALEAPQSLLNHLLDAGVSAQEFELLSQAKRLSDALTHIERQAMDMVPTGVQGNSSQRLAATEMLYDKAYLQAKAGVMAPILAFVELADERTALAVRQAKQLASVLRGVVIALGILVLVYLALVHRTLRLQMRAREQSDQQLRRLSQIYAALSECSQAMMRCKTPDELYEVVCRAAVRHGAIKMAWIGLVNAAQSRIEPVAMQGEGMEYVRGIDISVDPAQASGQGPSATAVRTNQPYWCQYFADDPRTAAWHARARKYGWGASASIPLHRDGRVFGVFNVYATEAHAFDPQVQDLLLEMAADVDYALHALGQEQAREAAQAQTEESEARLMLAYKGSHDALWDWNLQTGVLHYAPRWWEMIGLQPNTLPIDGDLWKRFMHPDDLPRIKKMLRQQMEDSSENFVAECRLRHQQGHYVPILVRAFITRGADGRPLRVSGTNMDLSERVHSQQMDALRGMMLERLSSDWPLAQLLDAYVRKLEDLLDDTLCAVLLLDSDGQHLMLGAAPHMPPRYATLLQQMALDSASGPCATAACLGQRVVVPDLAAGAYGAPYLEFVRSEGLVAGWAEPIHSGSNRVLGVLSVYRRSPVAVQAHEFALVEMAARIAAIAIERKRAELQLQLADKVFEQGGEVIMITDTQGRLVRVNDAFTRITGYTEAEALGRNPSMLASGKQDADFYRAMWSTLLAQGHWQGELWNRRKDGTLYPEWLSINELKDASGQVTNYVAIATDITQSKQDQEKIRLLADFDPLTGLPNRRLLQDRVATALSAAQRNQESLTLIFLDLDRFKNVNDSLGHHVGDALLVQVAQRLKGAVRDQDTVCRMGGDEFVLLCPGTDAAGAAHLASKLLEEISQRYLINGQEMTVTSSMGIALYPQDGNTYEALSMQADTAMYRAKQGGRNAFRFFAAEMQQESARALQLENGLRRALAENQLALVYQPQVDLHSGKVLGVEALLRWSHPLLGAVSPAEFIPVAEDSGLILEIGEWVLRTAVRQFRTWQHDGLGLDLVAVNLSAVQFRHPNLPDLVSRILQEEGLEPRCLELELTEGVALEDPVGAIAIMYQLHQRGVRMSIDDFGTGYSSLSYLKRFHVYKLKIDQSFVRDIADDAEDRAIVEAIIGLARSLGFKTIAEGVETQAQLAFLQEKGCDEVQGYLYSRPVNALALHAMVRQHQQAALAQATSLCADDQGG